MQQAKVQTVSEQLPNNLQDQQQHLSAKQVPSLQRSQLPVAAEATPAVAEAKVCPQEHQYGQLKDRGKERRVQGVKQEAIHPLQRTVVYHGKG